jgi:HEAT repeat protein
VLIGGLNDDNDWVRLHAINILDRLDQHARAAIPALETARRDKNEYVVRVAEHALRDLGHASKAASD